MRLNAHTKNPFNKCLTPNPTNMTLLEVLQINVPLPKNIEFWEIAIGILKGTGIASAIAGIKITYNWVMKMNQIKAAIPQINDKLDSIMKRFTPNGNQPDSYSFFDQLKELKTNSLINQNLLWGLIADSVEGIILTDVEGKWIKISRSFLRMIAASEDDVKNDNWSILLSDDCQREVLERYEELITHHKNGKIAATFRNGEKIAEVNMVVERLEISGTGFKITIKQI